MSDRKFELSRRKALLGLGTVGIASAGAGLGTSAYFSDEESFTGNEMVAGELDLKVGWQQIYYGPTEGDAVRPRDSQDGEFINAHPDGDDDGEQDITVDDQTYTWNDGGPTGSNTDVTDKISCDTLNHDYDFGDQDHLVELGDVKPGDGGQITFNLVLCDNPGYLWLTLSNFNEGGGANPEPERVAEGDDDNDADLAENMDVYVSTDENCNSRFNDEDEVIWSGTLADARNLVESDGNGLLLGDDCFDTGSHCINVGWEVPTDVGNEIQGDTVEFDIGFYTEQCRHNEDPSDPVITRTGEGWSKIEEDFNGDEQTESSFARARYGNQDEPAQTWELAVGNEPGDAAGGDYEWTENEAVDWSYEYDESNDEATFTVDGETVGPFELDDQPEGRVAIQAKATEATVTIADVEMDVDGTDATLTGPDSVTASSTDERDLQYLVVESTLDGDTSFEVGGTVEISLESGYDAGEEGVAFDVVLE